MNTIARTANADQLHAEVRDARTNDGHASTCDALDPCTSCKAKTSEVRGARLQARTVAVARPLVTIPVPRTALNARLAAARA